MSFISLLVFGKEFIIINDSLVIISVMVLLLSLIIKINDSLANYQKNVINKFGLFPILLMTDNPDKYQLSFDNFIYISFFYCILVFFIIFFRKELKNILYFIFVKIYSYKFIKILINYYLYLLISIKGLFELEFYLLPLIIIIPHSLFIFDMITHIFSIFENPLYLGAYFISIGILLISIDELASYFSKLCLIDSNHFIVKEFLIWLKDKNFHPSIENIYSRGFTTVVGKLTATGQAAVYGGIITLATGVAVASINGYSNFKGQQAQANAQAQAAQAQANAQAQAAQAQAQAQAQTAQAKYASKTKKAKYDYDYKRYSEEKKWEAYNKSWNPFKKPPES